MFIDLVERFGIRAGDSLSPRHATGGAEPKSVKDSKQQESETMIMIF